MSNMGYFGSQRDVIQVLMADHTRLRTCLRLLCLAILYKFQKIQLKMVKGQIQAFLTFKELYYYMYMYGFNGRIGSDSKSS